MKKKALITVISKQSNDDEDVIEIVTPGKFYKKDELYYAVYEETEISGMKGTTTTLKIDKNNFTLIRHGTTSARMSFKENSKDYTLYNTPHGALELSLDIKNVSIAIDDEGGKICAKYELAIEGQSPLMNKLEVNISAGEEIQ